MCKCNNYCILDSSNNMACHTISRGENKVDEIYNGLSALTVIVLLHLMLNRYIRGSSTHNQAVGSLNFEFRIKYTWNT
jgi:hypothetical protein